MIIYDMTKFEYRIIEDDAQLLESQVSVNFDELPEHIKNSINDRGFYKMYENHQCCSTDFYG